MDQNISNSQKTTTFQKVDIAFTGVGPVPAYAAYRSTGSRV